jgi:hypothetical protein
MVRCKADQKALSSSNRLYSMFALVALFLSCSTMPPEAELVAEEYEVYAVVLQSSLGNDRSAKIRILDSALRLSDPFLMRDNSSLMDWFPDYVPDVDIETVEDLSDGDKPSRFIDATFDVGIDYAFIDKESVRDFFQACELEDGLVIFSRVGFNHTMDQALVYVEVRGCGLWGGGYYVFLEKSQDTWIRREEVQSWGS